MQANVRFRRVRRESPLTKIEVDDREVKLTQRPETQLLMLFLNQSLFIRGTVVMDTLSYGSPTSYGSYGVFSELIH